MADDKKTPPPADPGPKTPAENPKVLAPKGTVPDAIAAPGPSLPHPSVDFGKEIKPDAATAKAQDRAADFPSDEAREAIAEEDRSKRGEPIKTIVRRKFFDERGALMKPGATYYYYPRVNPENGEAERFPIEVLEPVDEGLAKQLRGETKKRDTAKENAIKERDARRAALAKVALETE